MSTRTIAGALAFLLVAPLLVAYAIVRFGVVPANADGPIPEIERWAANVSLHATLDREAGNKPNPLPVTDANLIAGIKLYGTHCAVCHGAADGKASPIASGLYQKSPQLAKDGVEDDPASVTQWKLTHGIRFTGMPAFGKSLSEQQLWQISLFLEHMDKLPPAPQSVWKQMPSAAQPV